MLITKREYITRVKKKSFIIMTILGPILMAALLIVPSWLALQKDNTEKNIIVIDSSSHYKDILHSTEAIKFQFISNMDIEQAKTLAKDEKYYAVVSIPSEIVENKITIYSYKQPSIEVSTYIEQIIENEIEYQNLKKQNIDIQTLEAAKVDIKVDIYKWTKDGETEKSSTGVVMIIGFITAFLIYTFVFMYGAQVMRGVIEEKTSRVVEIIISSVKPFQLMMGKILGIALVALTQFVAWIIFTTLILIVVQPLVMNQNLNGQEITYNINDTNYNLNNANQIKQLGESANLSDMFLVISNIDFGMLIVCFLFYFLAGYLMYAALFAAIGGAVDNETDTQQFMIPLTVPLIVALMLSQTIIQNPDGSIAFWFSIIPLTSPVVMMIRIAFGVPDVVPYWELFLSMFLLVVTFIFTTWLAGKIYRTGILMYGKKVTYKELWKWIRYKN